VKYNLAKKHINSGIYRHILAIQVVVRWFHVSLSPPTVEFPTAICGAILYKYAKKIRNFQLE